VGQHFAAQIQQAYAKDDAIPLLLNWMKTPAGSTLYSQIVSNQNQYYPRYVDELRGLSDGAGIDFNQVMLSNLEPDLLLYLYPDDNDISKCSDVLLHPSSPSTTYLHGHNEDDSEYFQSLNFLLRTTPSTSPSSVNFTAYIYAGQLPGNAFGFTSSGLSVSINSLFPNQTLDPFSGAAQYFIMRDLLESTSLNDLIFRATQFPSFSGFSLNAASLNEKRLLNMEVAPGELYSVRSINALKPGVIGHFNMYLYLNGSVEQQVDTSSEARLNRFNEMEGEISMESGVRGFLGDTANARYPVYRTGDSDDTVTLATVVYDLTQKQVAIYVGNPKTALPLYVLPFH